MRSAIANNVILTKVPETIHQIDKLRHILALRLILFKKHLFFAKPCRPVVVDVNMNNNFSCQRSHRHEPFITPQISVATPSLPSDL